MQHEFTEPDNDAGVQARFGPPTTPEGRIERSASSAADAQSFKETRGLRVGIWMGAPLILHWSLLPTYGLIALGLLGEQGWSFSLLTLGLASVVLHEYGHVWAARRCGIPTRDVVVYPIGGLANLERMPLRRRDELFVTLAGPAVNLMVAILCVPIFLLAPSGATTDVVGLVLFLNIVIALFNLLPIYPLDGGRVLRVATVALAGPRWGVAASAAVAIAGSGWLLHEAWSDGSLVLGLIASIIFVIGVVELIAVAFPSLGEVEIPKSR